ncbi:1,2-phenylacetyl-CoA epoxidase subunit PaaD [Streptomyces acidiscabies]|uniref:Phenylacetic acid degradation protein PaaD n=1 Tax=Streptomyces acidiscabies TaxID=42234 RepID=A0A0L0K8V3_9ACTN|nr:1,2-phenylacetyl-CoA epoxidase subunit PaaD [Streptomyces acidiscabies]KND34547.1 phenylacetic acid degradation protein PaaD [Streptomyces acidiscabies]
MVTALEERLLAVAGSVLDPELPVLTLSELGVVRAVHVQGPGAVEVDLTPTYTGCPAVEAMSADIERALRAEGMREVTVRRVLAPAWSTDDITEEGRRKLREFGIAPPRVRRGPVPVSLGVTRGAGARVAGAASEERPPRGTPAGSPGALVDDAPILCPHCGSPDTELLSRFSSTACKALRRCRSCLEPFDHFKEL